MLFICSVVAHADEDSPPPLPERTPESYELADGAGWCCLCKELKYCMNY